MLDFGGTVATRGIQNTRTVFDMLKGIKLHQSYVVSQYTVNMLLNMFEMVHNFYIITNDVGQYEAQTIISYARYVQSIVPLHAPNMVFHIHQCKGRIQQTLTYEEQGAFGKRNHEKLTFTASMKLPWRGRFYFCSFAHRFKCRLKEKQFFEVMMTIPTAI